MTPVPKLQITAMMDMFTIIMIFLLVSFSSKPETLQLAADLQLPESSAEQDYSDSLRVVLSPGRLAVGDATVADLEGDRIVGLDPSRPQDSELYRELRRFRAELDAAGVAAGAAPGRHLLFFCDRRLPFRTVNQVIKTAGLAGFPNLQFAVLER